MLAIQQKRMNQSRKMVCFRQHSEGNPTSQEYNGMHHEVEKLVQEQEVTDTHLASSSSGSQSLLTGLFVLLALLEESLRDFDVLNQLTICQNPPSVTKLFLR